jgi:glycerol-3-phosphate cytidylyltransferase
MSDKMGAYRSNNKLIMQNNSTEKNTTSSGERDGKKIGITAGAFDLCHAGHIMAFKEARSVCDHLVVLLHDDPSVAPAEYRGKKKNVPIMSLEERRIILEGIRYVDEIITYQTEEDLYRLLVELKPDIRIIGADWKGKEYTGHDLPIEMYFNSRGHNYSTSELRERIYTAEKAKAESSGAIVVAANKNTDVVVQRERRERPSFASMILNALFLTRS